MDWRMLWTPLIFVGLSVFAVIMLSVLSSDEMNNKR